MRFTEQLFQSNGERKKPVSKSKKAGLVMPVHRIWKKLKKENHLYKIRVGGAIYLSAVLEYLSSEILELASINAKIKKKMRIIPHHILLAVKNDVELLELLSDVIIPQGGVIPFIHKALRPKNQQEGEN